MTRMPRKALVLAGLLAGGTSAAQAADAPAGALIPLTISYSEKVVDNLPLFIASDAGYFRREGLEVDVRYLAATEGIPALMTRQVQFATIGGSDALSAEAQGAKLKFLLTLSPVYTFQFWAQPQFAAKGALKGQRIGVTTSTGSLYSGTLLALQALGLEPSEVILTPLGSVTNVNNALAARTIAAAASHPPATYQFKEAGLVDLVDLPTKKVPSINAGLLSTASYIEANPKIVQAVVNAMAEAVKRERSDKAYTERELQKNFDIAAAPADLTYDFYVKEVQHWPPTAEVAQLRSNQKAMVASNPKIAAVNVADMVEPRFLEQAAK